MPSALLERRVERLERSLRQLRVLAFSLALLLLGAATSAFTRAAEVRAERIVLTSFADVPRVILTAGGESSLVIQAPDGRELLRLGEPTVRPVGP